MRMKQVRAVNHGNGLPCRSAPTKSRDQSCDNSIPKKPDSHGKSLDLSRVPQRITQRIVAFLSGISILLSPDSVICHDRRISCYSRMGNRKKGSGGYTAPEILPSCHPTQMIGGQGLWPPDLIDKAEWDIRLTLPTATIRRWLDHPFRYTIRYARRKESIASAQRFRCSAAYEQRFYPLSDPAASGEPHRTGTDQRSG